MPGLSQGRPQSRKASQWARSLETWLQSPSTPAHSACPAPRVRVGGCKARVSESASGRHIKVPHAHFLMSKIGRWKGTVGARHLSSSVTCETSQERLSDIFSECESSLGRPSLTMQTPASINLLEQSLKRQQGVYGCENNQATA